MRSETPGSDSAPGHPVLGVSRHVREGMTEEAPKKVPEKVQEEAPEKVPGVRSAPRQRPVIISGRVRATPTLRPTGN